MGEILFVRRISTTLLDGVHHHNFHQERAQPEAARGWVEHQATNLRSLRRSLITGSLNDASANNVVGRPVQDMKQSALPRCIKESMRWTIKECSFIQRLDERERDSVLGLSCQPHIDPVLISNDWRSNTHFEGATGKASGSLNWLTGELSFSCARHSALFAFHPATTK